MYKYLLLSLFLFSNFLFSADLIMEKIKNKDNSITIYAINPNLYDVTMKYNAFSKGLKTSREIPFETVLKSNSKTNILTITPISRNLEFRSKYQWILGNNKAKHNNKYLYRLPFGIGQTYKISQGFNGSFSHTGDSQYAVDFELDSGSKVFAAREGIVVDIKYDSNQGGSARGFIDKANFITIKHDDDTYATYAHLKQNGVVVKLGQKINRGELIGFSGNTGYSTSPHLHIVVFKAKDSKHRDTIPIKFITAQGIVSDLVTGKYLTAVK